MKIRLLAMTAAVLLAAGARAKDTSIKFAPPAYPMTNLVSNDAVDAGGFDYMHLGGNGFDLHCANLGAGGMDRYWQTGGFTGNAAVQAIYGTLDTGGGSDFTLFGWGTNFPINWYFDPLSHEDDDNSLPMYFGMHMGTMQMFGTYSYQTTIIDHYNYITVGPFTFAQPVMQDVTATTHLSILQFQVGWQFGVQYGLNLGQYLKVIPYLDISQDVYNFSLTETYTSFSHYGYTSPPPGTSVGMNLGALPISASPGFDLVLRKLGLSLGAAYQSTRQAGGSMKQLNLHLRWSTKFKSVCGL